MEYLTVIAAILLVDFIALISPGPNFVLITSAATSKSRQYALFTALGIAIGSLCWASAAAAGIASIFLAFPTLGLALKGVGVVYLFYLGIKMLRSRGLATSTPEHDTATSSINGFWSGLIVNLTNPKSAAYYASVFATFLTPDMPAWVLITLISAIASMSLIWHILLVLTLGTNHIKSRYISASKYVDRACGVLFVCLGLKLGLASI